jgi:hypothetical protein
MTQFRPELIAGVVAMYEFAPQYRHGAQGHMEGDRFVYDESFISWDDLRQDERDHYCQAAIALLKAVPVSDEMVDAIREYTQDDAIDAKDAIDSLLRFLTGDAS